MTFHTYDNLDTPEWGEALHLYHDAFPAGRKPDRIIEGTFAKKLGFLHTESDGDKLLAMAVTGPIPAGNLLLIDYLAVRKDWRGQGIGRRFVRDIAAWARDVKRASGLLIETEAEPGAENERRIRFWENCGFILTGYTHHYRFVPEPYRAMYLPFDPAVGPKDDGKSLFRHIEWYHQQAFAKP